MHRDAGGGGQGTGSAPTRGAHAALLLQLSDPGEPSMWCVPGTIWKVGEAKARVSPRPRLFGPVWGPVTRSPKQQPGSFVPSYNGKTHLIRNKNVCFQVYVSFPQASFLTLMVVLGDGERCCLPAKANPCPIRSPGPVATCAFTSVRRPWNLPLKLGFKCFLR